MDNGTNGNRWKAYFNKILKVIYEDGKSFQGSPHFATREGKLIGETDTHIIMIIDNVEKGINKQKILRFDIRGDSNGN